MKVEKPSIRPPDTCAHLEWVPGISTTPSRTPAPAILVSSPRITSGAPPSRRLVRPRDDQRRATAAQVGPGEAPAQGVDLDRAVQIGRLDPAVAASHHAGHHHRDVGMPVQPGADAPAQGVGEASRRDGRDPLVRAEALGHLSGAQHQIGAQPGGAPVHGDQSGAVAVRRVHGAAFPP